MGRVTALQQCQVKADQKLRGCDWTIFKSIKVFIYPIELEKLSLSLQYDAQAAIINTYYFDLFQSQCVLFSLVRFGTIWSHSTTDSQFTSAYWNEVNVTRQGPIRWAPGLVNRIQLNSQLKFKLGLHFVQLPNSKSIHGLSSIIFIT